MDPDYKVLFLYTLQLRFSDIQNTNISITIEVRTSAIIYKEKKADCIELWGLF